MHGGLPDNSSAPSLRRRGDELKRAHLMVTTRVTFGFGSKKRVIWLCAIPVEKIEMSYSAARFGYNSLSLAIAAASVISVFFGLTVGVRAFASLIVVALEQAKTRSSERVSR